MARPRIVVADDHDKTRAAIASLLASDFDVVSAVADGRAAVEAAGALYPDLVDGGAVRCRRNDHGLDAECFEDAINPILDTAAGGRKRLVRLCVECLPRRAVQHDL